LFRRQLFGLVLPVGMLTRLFSEFNEALTERL
jgi:hypothetical protein